MAKVILMAMSLRKESLNKKLISCAHQILQKESPEHDCDLLSFNDFPMPVYDGDIEIKPGIPEGVKALGAKVQSADALIFSTPEYNGGMPGPFKNALDWVSRLSPMPWPNKKILLLGASPGALGAVRGLWHSRVPLEAIGMFVFPEMFGLSQAHLAFDESGQLKDPATLERLKKLLLKFRDHVGRT